MKPCGAQRWRLSASLLRHVSAEAVYLGIVPGRGARVPGRAAPMRKLLDARSEAQSVHGLEMRTELAIGETVTELTRNLSAATAQMLVLGITDVREAGSAYRSLLAAQPGWPVLIVHRPPSRPARPRSPHEECPTARAERDPGFWNHAWIHHFILCAIVLIPLARWCSRRAAWNGSASSA